MNLKKFLFAMIAGCFFYAAPLKAQTATAVLQETPLKVYGDSVKFTATIKVEPHSVLGKEGYYRIMPELGDVKFKEIRIPSSELGDARKNGINVTISSSALFDEDMIGNDLEIESEYVYKDGRKNKETNDMDDLGECCVTVGTLFSLNGQYELMGFDFTPPTSTPLKVVAQINFPVDISKFSETQDQEKVNVIGNYLKAHPDAMITIRGFASPEGPADRNKKLAEERAQAAKNWLVKALDDKGFSKFYNKNSIKIETTSEDWKGFQQLVENSNLPREKQNEIVKAVTSTENLKQTEERLMSVVGDRKAVEKFLRPLRRATIVVSSKNAFRSGYTSEQIDSLNKETLAGDIPVSSLKDIYGQEEYLQAYVSNDSTQGKITMLTSYSKAYPADLRVYSDLGALTAVDMHSVDIVGGDDALVGIGFNRDMVDIDTELDVDRDKVKYKYKYKEEDVKDPEKIKIKYKADLEKMEKAKVYLVKAVDENNKDFVALNNLGAWYLTSGDYEMAKEYLDQSYKLDKSQQGVNYNLGVLYARKGDNKKALEHFNKANKVSGIEYNRGIARYLAGDYQGAKKDFVTFSNSNPEFAIGHYLVAVAAAQTGDDKLLYDKLQQAIKLNNNLADVAAGDLAFGKYWDKEEFENASDDDPDDN